ncbi:hypothetical protein Acr_00g0087430 [Actinidia rufa]|uniref:MATH domain-containing protein n=1 Tax=Actinidia rufa TaxID=165716 RepID=A0A7J0DWA7_9ERIC|nr:hypothetical protein Acr_00g0087430 [Actinidia rufa]
MSGCGCLAVEHRDFVKLSTILDPELGFLQDENLKIAVGIEFLDEIKNSKIIKKPGSACVKFDWEIRNFNLSRLLVENGHQLSSPVFDVGKSKFFITLCDRLIEGEERLVLALDCEEILKIPDISRFFAEDESFKDMKVDTLGSFTCFSKLKIKNLKVESKSIECEGRLDRDNPLDGNVASVKFSSFINQDDALKDHVIARNMKGVAIRSPWFLFGDHRFYMVICPTGESDNGQTLCYFLEGVGPDWKSYLWIIKNMKCFIGMNDKEKVSKCFQVEGAILWLVVWSPQGEYIKMRLGFDSSIPEHKSVNIKCKLGICSKSDLVFEIRQITEYLYFPVDDTISCLKETLSDFVGFFCEVLPYSPREEIKNLNKEIDALIRERNNKEEENRALAERIRELNKEILNKDKRIQEVELYGERPWSNSQYHGDTDAGLDDQDNFCRNLFILL